SSTPGGENLSASVHSSSRTDRRSRSSQNIDFPLRGGWMQDQPADGELAHEEDHEPRDDDGPQPPAGAGEEVPGAELVHLLRENETVVHIEADQRQDADHAGDAGE